jgi:hypothetical protein
MPSWRSHRVPEELWHGSPQTDLESFQVGIPAMRTGPFGSPDEIVSQAVFLSPRREVADFFGRNRAEARGSRQYRVYRVKADLRNPVDLRRPRSEKFHAAMRKAEIDVFRVFGFLSMDYVENRFPGNLAMEPEQAWELLDNPEVVRKLREAGYDGAILRESGGRGVSYAVFDPGRARISAFDPGRSRIAAKRLIR